MGNRKEAVGLQVMGHRTSSDKEAMYSSWYGYLPYPTSEASIHPGDQTERSGSSGGPSGLASLDGRTYCAARAACPSVWLIASPARPLGEAG